MRTNDNEFGVIEDKFRCDACGADIRRNEKVRERREERKPYVSFFLVMFLTTMVLLCRLFIFDVNVVSGLSMYPTLDDKDLLIVEKYDTTNISRYDIVTADVEEDGKVLTVIKRVYGLPGETVDLYSDGSVYINGHRLDDAYQILENDIDEKPMKISTVTLNVGEYFVLGDNRGISLDSRAFGPISREHIRGVVMTRVKPFTSIDKTTIVPSN